MCHIPETGLVLIVTNIDEPMQISILTSKFLNALCPLITRDL